ncbi:chemotaxis protein CheW [Methanospirillum sp. J.3.6.1-F.2.7.3]|uniref:Chemotaxis protein CheW n=2 Tax=Methanospirillum TaxID=2202 RepID=A0A8E7EHE0_9EURY|nr:MULTISPECIES: chemotaxis protein CheW [Methanospirillum]MDX8549218.1 chemotaxis protein CheW [Methanospirillum hungatei]NLW76661.1 purine-binding chemotaxis protein CheW [Methanomicrobiales archaeon]QVV88887.1 chemotaxis protein CheW [Methanospirillum sp. J.3.6.1-F.2.7.3]QXO93771.1 chemotaxis protein CheW [Methanospirillum hungatei]
MGTFLVDYQSHDEPVEKVPEITNQAVKKIRAGSKGVGNLQVVEFILGNELFAIDLFETREVINYTEITPLPNTPSFIKGIIDLRGIITTIIDLKEMMNITREADGKKKSRIIVLDATVSEKMIGVLVDDVLAVSTYTEEDIDKDTHASKSSDRDILGIIRKKVKTGDRDKSDLIIWLDIKTMIHKVEQDL